MSGSMAGSVTIGRMRYPNGRRIRLHAAIGVRLQEVAAQHGQSVAAVARAIGVEPRTLHRVTTGALAPPVWMLVAIAEHLDCCVDELIPVMVDERSPDA